MDIKKFSSKDDIIAAVEKNGLELKYASEMMKNDKDVVLAAVKQNSYALSFASDELKNDEDIIAAALETTENEPISKEKSNLMKIITAIIVIVIIIILLLLHGCSGQAVETEIPEEIEPEETVVVVEKGLITLLSYDGLIVPERELESEQEIILIDEETEEEYITEEIEETTTNTSTDADAESVTVVVSTSTDTDISTPRVCPEFCVNAKRQYKKAN